MKNNRKAFTALEFLLAIIAIGILIAISAHLFLNTSTPTAETQQETTQAETDKEKDPAETLRINANKCDQYIGIIKAKASAYNGDYPDNLKQFIEGLTCPVNGQNYEDIIVTGPSVERPYLDFTQHKH